MTSLPSSPNVGADVTEQGAARPAALRGALRGFAGLDERVAGRVQGVAVARAPSYETANALAAHLARRARAVGLLTIEARAQEGAPLWCEVASRLGIGALASDPRDAALALVHAATVQQTAVIGPLPPRGGWDRAVACELALLPGGPTVILVTASLDGGEDFAGEVYEVATTLDASERQRWFSTMAGAASTEIDADALPTLAAWWTNARRAPLSRTGADTPLPPSCERVLAVLALAARSWPVSDLTGLAVEAIDVEALARLGAAQVASGWLCIDPAWQRRAEHAAETAAPEGLGKVARALATRFPSDPWAQARAGELLVRAGDWAAADEAQTRAASLAESSLARREIITRWMTAVATLPLDAQRLLRVRAAERAWALGEAEEAFRWAQSATALAPADPQVILLFGRAAVALGDLVAAKVALERGGEHAQDDATRAVIAAELAEVAYLSGDRAAAAQQADRALGLDGGAAARLSARNTLGKLLLAESSWDAADVHFAEDTWMAAASSLRTEELRARLNRGVALLSKGSVDEARATFEGVLADAQGIGDERACAFALENLHVVATMRHEYASSLAFAEQALKLRQRIGDRVATARLLANLAELRRRLGLLEHAEHAVAFGRRTLGPGMPPARSSHFSLQAARNALARGCTVEARREATRALADSEAAGVRNYVAEARCVLARTALEDGDLARMAEQLEQARALATTEALRAETAALAARYARACGNDSEWLGIEALAAARTSGEEDLVIEGHVLLAEVHRAAGRLDAARGDIEQAVALRDQIAATLPPGEMRGAFLSRPDFMALCRLRAAIGESDGGMLPPPSSPMVARERRPLARAVPREMVGDDPAIRGLLAAVKKVARSNSTILVRGESGTGKELVAEAIHHASNRAAGPLVTVNCAALVETLLLSELFGHEKGAFTGAVARRRGRFELAEGGTLFLDEIGDVSPRTQAALLRVLQERTFERVGGTTHVRADVRVVCATHRDLKAMVDRGEFREDLYYRLRGITLEVPPLRARLGDLPRISEHLLLRIAVERDEAKKSLSDDALDLLGRHRWPGNVRELENALRAASLFAEGDTIRAATLVENIDELRSVAASAATNPSESAGPSAASSTPGPASRTRPTMPPPSGIFSSVEALPPETVLPEDDIDLGDGPLPAAETHATAIAYAQVRCGTVSLPDIKRQIERDCIARALAETRGNITRAATLLGMKRPRLSQLVKQYGLAVVSAEGSS